MAPETPHGCFTLAGQRSSVFPLPHVSWAAWDHGGQDAFTYLGPKFPCWTRKASLFIFANQQAMQLLPHNGWREAEADVVFLAFSRLWLQPKGFGLYLCRHISGCPVDSGIWFSKFFIPHNNGSVKSFCTIRPVMSNPWTSNFSVPIDLLLSVKQTSVADLYLHFALM